MIKRYPIPNAEIERIYIHYPRKRGKLAAFRAIRQALEKSGWTVRRMAARVAAYAKSIDVETKFIPYPATYFNRGDYLDEPDPSSKSTVQPGQPRSRIPMLPALPSRYWHIIRLQFGKDFSGQWPLFCMNCLSDTIPLAMRLSMHPCIEIDFPDGTVRVKVPGDLDREKQCNEELAKLHTNSA